MEQTNYDENVLDQIVSDLENRVDTPVLSIDKIESKTGAAPEYRLLIHFNDTFDWASAYAMVFEKHYNDPHKLCEDFYKFFTIHKQVFAEFKNVPYPEYDSQTASYFIRDAAGEKCYDNDPLEAFFKANCEIGLRLLNAINVYCGREQVTEL